MVETLLRQPLRLKLFTNDSLDMYEELKGYGYSDAQLQVVSLTTSPSGVLASFAPVTFKFSGPAGRIYGSYAVHQPTNTIIWADRMAEAFKALNNGDSLTVEPVFMLGGVT